MQATRSFFIHLLLICVGISFALVCSELLLRMFYPTCTVLRTFDYQRGVHLSPNQSAICSNGEFRVEVRSNSLGFHDHEHTVAPEKNSCRVLFLGDSLIEAVQVDMEESVTRLTENELREKSKQQIDVLNFASSGAGPSQYLQVLKTLGLNYSPDMVVLWLYLGNDIRNSHRSLQPSVTMPFHTLDSDEKLVFHPPPAEIPDSSLRKFFGGITLFRIIREAIRETPLQKPFVALGLAAHEGKASWNRKGIPMDWYSYKIPLDEEWNDAYRTVFAILKEVKRILAERDIPLLVAVIPTNLNIEDRWQEALKYHNVEYHADEWDFDMPRRKVLEALHNLDIPVLDLLPSMQKDYQSHGISHSWKKDAHWNQRGHQIASQAVQPYIMESIDSCFENTAASK